MSLHARVRSLISQAKTGQAIQTLQAALRGNADEFGNIEQPGPRTELLTAIITQAYGKNGRTAF